MLVEMPAVAAILTNYECRHPFVCRPRLQHFHHRRPSVAFFTQHSLGLSIAGVKDVLVHVVAVRVVQTFFFFEPV